MPRAGRRVILFLFYAVLVWYFCFRWRRQWMGVVSVAAGVACVFLLSMLVHSISRWFQRAGIGAGADVRLFDYLLMVEAGVVGIVGMFIVLLPRERVQKPCRGCGYELAGLDEENPRCPECGLAGAAARVRRRRCVGCGVRAELAAGTSRCAACIGALNGAAAGRRGPPTATEEASPR
ncbi:MAG: hypothetical protein KF864_00795 [Phycisphaeraceae bacterium]|nr:hypothetical protein [Phycisphaeraceae bacterium]